MSFLGLDGLHVFVTGAAGGIGSQAVQEFLNQGCKVTAHDRKPSPLKTAANLYTVQGDISDEESIETCFTKAKDHFGPVNILVANAGITDESSEYFIWETPLDLWEKIYHTNIRGTFLTIKHFLRSAKSSQEHQGSELEHLAIVVTGSETGKFGQAGHTEYASGKAGLQYGLVRGVKNEIVKLNSNARINAVAPGWVDTPLIEGRLDDPKELWVEAQATVALKKIAKPQDVARAMAFLASHRAAGHISGECLSVDGGMEGRVVWKESGVLPGSESSPKSAAPLSIATPTAGLSIRPKTPKRRIRIALSVDFDALSGWLGTGKHPDNNMADYSQGFFAGKVGAPRLVRLFRKLGIADKMTWFIPGHSMETFPHEVREVVNSGCEIALHGYSHEGAYQMTEEQERDVLKKCIELASKLTGKKPVGYRAPLYQLRESTVSLLEEHGFEYDTSLSHHDSQPYFAPRHAPIQAPDFDKPAALWMHPITVDKEAANTRSLVEIPCNWYMEDMTPLSFLPHTPNSHGYVDIRSLEQMWKDRFMWLRENGPNDDTEMNDFLFPLILHPDTSGMPHVIAMVERILTWVKGWGDEVEFWRYEEIAKEFRQTQQKKTS